MFSENVVMTFRRERAVLPVTKNAILKSLAQDTETALRQARGLPDQRNEQAGMMDYPLCVRV